MERERQGPKRRELGAVWCGVEVKGMFVYI
jgi:hypothetical protein